MPRHLLAPVAFSVVASLFASACAPAEDASSTPASDESNQTSSNWATKEIGDRPNRDIGDNERVSIAVDARGQKHAVYLGRDSKTHYVDLSANRDEIIPAEQTSHHALALDPSGQPVVGFYSSQGAVVATKRNGAWVVEPVGTPGYFDQIAVDATGAIHVATNGYDAAGESIATLSTKRAGASAFEHAQIPGKLPREIGFSAYALAADRSGTAYLFLSSFESIQTAPRASTSGPLHGYFAKKPAGGAIVVEPMPEDKTASAGSLTVDGSGVLHAVLSVKSPIADHDNTPVYVKRGAADAAWSAPEKIYWDGYYTSLALDANGGLHVAFTGSRSSFVAYATKPAGGAWATTVIRSVDADVPSIALDERGKPLVAYRDGAYMLATPPAQ